MNRLTDALAIIGGSALLYAAIVAYAPVVLPFSKRLAKWEREFCRKPRLSTVVAMLRRRSRARARARAKHEQRHKYDGLFLPMRNPDRRQDLDRLTEDLVRSRTLMERGQ